MWWAYPLCLRAFARVTPEACPVRTLTTILFKEAGVSAVSRDILFLLCFTLAMMTVAIASFRRTL